MSNAVDTPLAKSNAASVRVPSGDLLALRAMVEANDEWLKKSQNLYRDEQKRIGRWARDRREDASVSLREVARRMGVSAPHLSDLERGNRNWTADMLTAWESALANAGSQRAEDSNRKP